MNKIKAYALNIWKNKYLFILCFILAFLAWQGIHHNISGDDEIFYERLFDIDTNSEN